MSEQVTVELSDLEQQALHHELTDQFGREIRAGIFEKLRTAPASPQPATGGEDGWPAFVYVKQRPDGSYGAAVHKPGPAEGEITRLYVPAPDSGEGER